MEREGAGLTMNIYEQYGRLAEEYTRATEQLKLTESVLLKLKSGELTIDKVNIGPPANGVVPTDAILAEPIKDSKIG
jgi:hypothetical protein